MSKIILLICLFFTSAAFSNSPIGERKVVKLIFHDSGNLYVYFSGVPTHSENCNSKSEYILPKEHQFFSQIYSGLLAAMYSKSPVNGYVNGCINVWSNTKTKITRIDLMP
ncbi:hypothetical protein [Pseudoalteromonas marina]|uniref:hypothetical protein n=1 Tax=Pseudoalteromonas marina TaxID=267375 RepID=UPI0023F4BC0C|nr:hypothetical protein [Pseudoalteromonas marina]